MLSVVVLNVIMLNVVAPLYGVDYDCKKFFSTGPWDQYYKT